MARTRSESDAEGEIARLDSLVAWMRRRGVIRLQAGETELLLGPEPTKAPTLAIVKRADESDEQHKQRVANQRKADAEAKKRETYKQLLGREPSDAELRAFP